MLLGELAAGVRELHRDEAQSFLLEAMNQRADEPTLNAIGFEKDEGALHETNSHLRLLIFRKVMRVFSPLSPVLGGEGPGVRGPSRPTHHPPHPQPLSPEYRGEGSQSVLLSRRSVNEE